MFLFYYNPQHFEAEKMNSFAKNLPVNCQCHKVRLEFHSLLQEYNMDELTEDYSLSRHYYLQPSHSVCFSFHSHLKPEDLLLTIY